MWWSLWIGLALAPAPAWAADRRTPVVMAVERATPAVVTITLEVEQQSPFWFFDAPSVGRADGSGVILDPRGIVLTNAHVVDGARAILVHLEDGTQVSAQLVAMEPDLDLAVLRLDGDRKYPTIAVADSDSLLLGEPAIAIGNPYGLGLTVSTGVISSTAREVEIAPGLFQTYIQTDAAINPGNSGGALVNIDGALIGINTMIRANAEGIGWAIPVNRARKIADDLMAYGEVRFPWLGADFRDVAPRRTPGSPLEKGAIRVQTVHPGGPAAKAGLKPGDMVVEVAGRRTASRADLNAQLAALKPGVTLDVGVVRDGAPMPIKLTTVAMPETLADVSIQGVLGIGFERAPGGRGLVITSADARGSFAQAGLRPGDVVLAVDGRPVDSPEALRAAIAHAKARHLGTALFTVVRGRYRGNISLAV